MEHLFMAYQQAMDFDAAGTPTERTSKGDMAARERDARKSRSETSTPTTKVEEKPSSTKECSKTMLVNAEVDEILPLFSPDQQALLAHTVNWDGVERLAGTGVAPRFFPAYDPCDSPSNTTSGGGDGEGCDNSESGTTATSTSYGYDTISLHASGNSDSDSDGERSLEASNVSDEEFMAAISRASLSFKVRNAFLVGHSSPSPLEHPWPSSAGPVPWSQVDAFTKARAAAGPVSGAQRRIVGYIKKVALLVLCLIVLGICTGCHDGGSPVASGPVTAMTLYNKHDIGHLAESGITVDELVSDIEAGNIGHTGSATEAADELSSTFGHRTFRRRAAGAAMVVDRLDLHIRAVERMRLTREGILEVHNSRATLTEAVEEHPFYGLLVRPSFSFMPDPDSMPAPAAVEVHDRRVGWFARWLDHLAQKFKAVFGALVNRQWIFRW